jgi:hypothetical protein
MAEVSDPALRRRIDNQTWLVNRLMGIVRMVREGTWSDNDVAYEAAAIRDQIEKV